jgi:hypothetical protein
LYFCSLIKSIATIDRDLPRYHPNFVQEEVILPSDYHSDCSKQACEMCMRAESLIEKYRSFDSRSTLKYQKWVKQANSRFSKLTSWCKEEFTDNNPKHRHHNHYNGEYVATICQKCNIREGKYTKFISIIAHNSTYDKTLMIKELAKNM